jgi:hypothetical protein
MGSFTPKVLKQVTRPALKVDFEKPVFVKITSEMREGTAQKTARAAAAGAEPRKPPTIVDAVNLETAELCVLILGTVLKGIFEDNYAGGAYVGKCFQIVKHEKVRGRDYNTYDVSEIEDPTPTAQPAQLESHRGRRA